MLCASVDGAALWAHDRLREVAPRRTELVTDLAKDAFNNPFARVMVLSTKPNSTPLDVKALNGDPKSTNSWPRWSRLGAVLRFA